MKIKDVSTDSSKIVGNKAAQIASFSETVYTMITLFVKVHTCLTNKNVGTIITQIKKMIFFAANVNM